MASEEIQKFEHYWDTCLVPKLEDAFVGTPFGEALGSLFNDAFMEALKNALEIEGSLITSLLTVELQFLCNLSESTGSGYPNAHYAKLEKLKIFIKSLIALLDALDEKSKKTLAHSHRIPLLGAIAAGR